MSKVIAAVVVVFVGFWMYTDPSGLAGAAGSSATTAKDMTGQFFGALVNFFDAL